MVLGERQHAGVEVDRRQLPVQEPVSGPGSGRGAGRTDVPHGVHCSSLRCMGESGGAPSGPMAHDHPLRLSADRSRGARGPASAVRQIYQRVAGFCGKASQPPYRRARPAAGGAPRLQQLGTALPAIDGPATVQRPAGRAVAGRAAALHQQQPLDLSQLGVDPLELGRRAHQHVEAEVVADRHLVGQAAQVPLELGQPLGQALPLPRQVAGPDGAPPPGGRRAAGAGPQPELRRGKIRRGRSFDHVSAPRRPRASCRPWAAPCRAAWSCRAASWPSPGTPLARGPRAP